MLASPPVQRIAAMAHAGGACRSNLGGYKALSQRQRADGTPEFADDSSETNAGTSAGDSTFPCIL